MLHLILIHVYDTICSIFSLIKILPLFSCVAVRSRRGHEWTGKIYPQFSVLRLVLDSGECLPCLIISPMFLAHPFELMSTGSAGESKLGVSVIFRAHDEYHKNC
jgi:hypothetical protein